MADLSSRKVLGLNQQTYQRLKLALGLNLRRQIFLAVCDDLPLRDRLSEQLRLELSGASSMPSDRQRLTSGLASYPRLVTLHLNLNLLNPITQISNWLAESPPPRNGKRWFPMPAFQFVGLEHLTRQPASVQRMFLAYLQEVEENLPELDSSLLFWMSQPWFRALPQSAPEFWQCRTAVFEFVGEPKPLTLMRPEVMTVGDRQQVETAAVTASVPAAADCKSPVLTTVRPKAAAMSATAAAATAAVLERLPRELMRWEAEQAQEQAVAVQVVEEPRKTPPPPPPFGALGPILGRTVEVTAQAVDDSQHSQQLAPGNLNLEQHLIHQIEELRQQQASPLMIAEAYRSLGDWYRDRLEVEIPTEELIRTTIEAYEQVLRWLPQNAADWSDVLNDLGNLYWMLSRQTTETEAAIAHLSQSIQAYQMALTRLSQDEEMMGYPMIQNNLGAAYNDLSRHRDPAENLIRSIQAYREALRFRTPENAPLQYAATQNNLGTAYWNLAQHQQPETRLQQAIAAYEAALRYYLPTQDPLSFAMIQNNLGTAYWNLSQHEHPQENLQQAIAAYQTALQFRTREAAPLAFAATQNNLGTAYWHLATHLADQPAQQASYLSQSIQAYEVAIAAVENQPNSTFDRFATHNNLGLAHYQFATQSHLPAQPEDQIKHLESALHHHLQAFQGWQNRRDQSQTAFQGILQTVRALHQKAGLDAQNIAFSMIPAYLLPEILPKL